MVKSLIEAEKEFEESKTYLINHQIYTGFRGNSSEVLGVPISRDSEVYSLEGLQTGLSRLANASRQLAEHRGDDSPDKLYQGALEEIDSRANPLAEGLLTFGASLGSIRERSVEPSHSPGK